MVVFVPDSQSFSSPTSTTLTAIVTGRSQRSTDATWSPPRTTSSSSLDPMAWKHNTNPRLGSGRVWILGSLRRKRPRAVEMGSWGFHDGVGFHGSSKLWSLASIVNVGPSPSSGSYDSKSRHSRRRPTILAYHLVGKNWFGVPCWRRR
jgi:hypothetical protein